MATKIFLKQKKNINALERVGTKIIIENNKIFFIQIIHTKYSNKQMFGFPYFDDKKTSSLKIRFKTLVIQDLYKPCFPIF